MEQGEGSRQPSKVEEGKGKKLEIVKLNATRQNKVVIIEPKVKEDLQKNMQEMVTQSREK